MTFGDRQIEADEPVLYFDNISLSMLSEQSREKYARGGWLNQPKVIWQDRSEIRFQMSQGVVSQFGFGILLGAKVAIKGSKEKPIYMHTVEGPFKFDLDDTEPIIKLEHEPVYPNEKKIFIFDYERDAIQQKIYGVNNGTEGEGDFKKYKIKLYKDKYPYMTEEQRRIAFPEDYRERRQGAASCSHPWQEPRAQSRQYTCQPVKPP